MIARAEWFSNIAVNILPPPVTGPSIRSHVIDYVIHMDHCLPQSKLFMTRVNSVWKDDKKHKKMSIFQSHSALWELETRYAESIGYFQHKNQLCFVWKLLCITRIIRQCSVSDQCIWIKCKIIECACSITVISPNTYTTNSSHKKARYRVSGVVSRLYLCIIFENAELYAVSRYERLWFIYVCVWFPLAIYIYIIRYLNIRFPQEPVEVLQCHELIVCLFDLNRYLPHHVIRTVVRKLIGRNSNRFGNYFSMKTLLSARHVMIDWCL